MFRKNMIQICRQINSASKSNVQKRWNSELEYYEPPYLKNLKPKVPVYEAVTIQIKGYDFPPLENFQKFAHSVAEYMNLNVETCWAHPGRNYTINTFQPFTKTLDKTYTLIMYERDVKLINVPATKLPIYSEILQAALPEGTTLRIMQFDENHYNEKFVPDYDLKEKMKELEELGGPPEEDDPNEFIPN